MAAAIDWPAPWFAPWREAGERVAARVALGEPLEQALNAAGDAPVGFVPAQARPAAMPYERYIFESGLCPVRAGLHDFFNGLAWLAWPRSKAALNALQAAEIARDGIGARRGPVRDAVTVFDENGALLHAPPPLWDALRSRDWRRLFVDLGPLWRDARVTIFGHALLEQLAARPRKNLTAHVWRADAPAGSTAELDGWLAAQMNAETLASKPFTPLPVAGVPGWWPGNSQVSFYDDPAVFRPRRNLNCAAPAPVVAPGSPCRPSENP